MADDSKKFPAGFIIFVLFSLLVSVAFCQRERIDLNQCIDGTYKHDGGDCCLCGAGQYLVEHCSTSLPKGKCENCESGTYRRHPSAQKSCEPCTSCSHPSANLEEDEPCTSARDTKCRCKKDHYCGNGTEICRLCHPCEQCGAEGIKVRCTANSDTVCNVKMEGGNQLGTIVGITVPIVLLAVVAAVIIIFLRKRQQADDPQTNGSATDVEMQHLRDVDIQLHLPDIAKEIGWKDMQDIAMRSGIGNAIDVCKLDYPGDSQEQTLQLLKVWVESQGRGAPRNLIQNLNQIGRKGKAEKVTDILSRDS
ncbi:tumor necrosis factor receptor superfamily member 6 [Enoplosus armatus]|uniref:tumor necrosis factor receptor superfamily member 6 n=1 Tax=Enoplosus armatus TaxID=215367 RepID=UPI003995EA2C